MGAGIPGPDVAGWPAFLRLLAAEERRWHRYRAAGVPDGYVGWIPYPLAAFVTYLTDAVGAATRPSFLDVGCGPGTKVLLASALFGLRSAGIDIVPGFAARARELGADAQVADALAYDRYHEPGIVFMNRPLTGTARAVLEERVMTQMAPGAVLILVNGSRRPAEHGWDVVAEDADTGDGAWRKP